ANGEVVSVDALDISVIYDGQPAKLSVLHDVTLYRERENQLTTANKELDGTIALVAHELRTYLAVIAGYTSLLLRRRLEESIQGTLKTIERNARRIEEALSAIMDLARANYQEIKYDKINLTGLAYKVKGELEEQNPQRAASFMIQEGLVANGDNRLLEIVLRNLLSNAWKYSGRLADRRAVIDFGYKSYDGQNTQHQGKEVYFVSDNGVGFEPAKAHELFGLFSRLHNKGEYDGIGLGLRNAERSIRRHGGEIWAESPVPDGRGGFRQGAIFYFTLPARQG
ncbi:HAMP domain-containing histidine kinase, partial [Candidatus Woesearchaeota archaeon]|nr:HAMP domain-containing histidine kinase [Candidatus Woesearchaeota archaeon]